LEQLHNSVALLLSLSDSASSVLGIWISRLPVKSQAVGLAMGTRRSL
jgi:hypothetical protein